MLPLFLLLQTGKNQVDHQAAAYVAPRRTLAEANGNGHSADADGAADAAADGKPKAATPPPKKPAASASASAPKCSNKWGGAEKCPRCDKSVFIAELMRGAGKAWHKTCFTCLECRKRLDSSMLCEREGEIYCKGKKDRGVDTSTLHVHDLIFLCRFSFFSLLRSQLRSQRVRIRDRRWSPADVLGGLSQQRKKKQSSE